MWTKKSKMLFVLYKGTSKNSRKLRRYDIMKTQGGERDADWFLG